MGNSSAAKIDRATARRDAARRNENQIDNGCDNMVNAGPGWYYDPEDEAIYRYWNGEQWTDHRSDTVLSEVPS